MTSQNEKSKPAKKSPLTPRTTPAGAPKPDGFRGGVRNRWSEVNALDANLESDDLLSDDFPPMSEWP